MNDCARSRQNDVPDAIIRLEMTPWSKPIKAGEPVQRKQASDLCG
jgi:hypothetical protein